MLLRSKGVERIFNRNGKNNEINEFDVRYHNGHRNFLRALLTAQINFSRLILGP